MSFWSRSPVTYTDTATTTTADTRKFFRVKEVIPANGPLQSGDILTINQIWSEEPGGYDRTALFQVSASGTGPFPVVLILHGSGGNTGFINSLGNQINSIIRIAPVAPQGYGNQ